MPTSLRKIHKQYFEFAFKKNCSFANDWSWLVGAPFFGWGSTYATQHWKMWGKAMTLPDASTIGGTFEIALGSFAIAWIIGFIIRLVKSPAIIYQELERKYEELQLKIHNKEIRQSIINKVWDLRDHGIRIRNNHETVTTADEYAKWKHEFELWRVDILREVDVIHKNLQRFNHTVGIINLALIPPFKASFTSPQFIGDYNLMAENLNRIDEYLKREIFLEQETYFR